MGTNYYWSADPCPTCGRGDELHIGKSSAGWCFALHIYPEEGIHTLADWQERWRFGRIRDEYGKTLTADEMLSEVIDRGPWIHKNDPTPEFLARNYAQIGPRGLLRSTWRNTRPGEGTYDLWEGEFS